MVAVNQQPVAGRQITEKHVRVRFGGKNQCLQRRSAFLEHRRVGRFRGVELINDVNGLCRHADAGHELVERDDLIRLLFGAANEVPELDAKENLAVGAELRVELGRHRVQVRLLVQRLPELFPQLRVNGLGIVVPHETQAGIDLLLQELAVQAAETRQHADEQRHEVRSIGSIERAAKHPANPVGNGFTGPTQTRAQPARRQAAELTVTGRQRDGIGLAFGAGRRGRDGRSGKRGGHRRGG